MDDHKHADNIESLLDEGLELYGRNRVTEAVRCWQRALRLRPTDTRARDYLESAGIIPANDTDEDLAEQKKGARPLSVPPLEDASPPTQDAIVALVKDHRFEEALALLRRARAMNPEDHAVSRSLRLLKERMTLAYASKIGDLDCVPCLLRALEELTALEVDATTMQVLRLVDGIATYGDILDVAHAERFETYRALANALSRGLVESTRPVRSFEPTTATRRQIVAPPVPARLEAAPVPVLAPAAAPEPAPAPVVDEYDALFARATMAYARRNYGEAHTLFQRCLELRPEDRRALHNLKQLDARGKDNKVR